jgi:hypothetical protein
MVGLFWLTILIIVAGAWTTGASQAAADEFPDSLDVFEGGAAPEPGVDLYGNEIEPAVSDYRIDFRGEVYERHAPDVEVTRLAPPSL